MQNYAYEFPHFATQQAWNYSSSGLVGNTANDLIKNITAIEKVNLLLRTGPSKQKWQPLPQVSKTLIVNNSYAHSVSITPDSKLASAGYDKSCILWNIRNGEVIKSFNEHKTGVDGVSVSANGAYAISCSLGGTCVFYDLKKYVAKKIEFCTSTCSSLSITADGNYIIAVSDINTDAILWDTFSNSLVKTLKWHNEPITSVSITANGKTSITGSKDTRCILWDIQSASPLKTLEEHKRPITSVYITPNGKYAISASEDNTCIFWDFEQELKYKIFHFDNFEEIVSVSLTPDGKLAIAASRYKRCVLWNTDDENQNKILYGHTNVINAITINAIGTKAVSASSDKTIKVWDLESSGIVIPPDEYIFGVKAVSINYDGAYALSSSYNDTIIFWDCQTGNHKKLLDLNKTHSGYDINDIAITPCGKYSLSVCMGSKLKIWNIKKTFKIKTLQGIHANPIGCVTVSPDGKYAISGSSDNSIVYWDLDKYRGIKTLQNAYNAEVFAVCFLPDGKCIISCCLDKTCVLWNLHTGTIMKTFTGHTDGVTSISISPDGKYLLSGSLDKTSIVWDTNTGQISKVLSGHTDLINSVYFINNGKYALTGSNDKTCILWDWQNEKILNRFIGQNSISDIAYSPTTTVLGMGSGEIVFLKNNLTIAQNEYGITTIKAIWKLGNHKYQSLTADCPFCGKRFKPARSSVKSIKRIIRNAGLTSNQSPCLELPDKAWEHPGLLSECPKCGEKLKFNPFIAGGEEY